MNRRNKIRRRRLKRGFSGVFYADRILKLNAEWFREWEEENARNPIIKIEERLDPELELYFCFATRRDGTESFTGLSWRHTCGVLLTPGCAAIKRLLK